MGGVVEKSGPKCCAGKALWASCVCVCGGGGAVPRGEVTVSFIIQTRILLRVKGGAINNYDRASGLNWDYPGKLGRVVTCLKREIDVLLSSPTQTNTSELCPDCRFHRHAGDLILHQTERFPPLSHPDTSTSL